METLSDKIESMLTPDKDGLIHPETIQVGGVKITQIKDKKGRVWAIPADDANVDTREFRNILQIPNPEPGFYYQYVGSDRLNEFLSQDFALVEPDEVGLPNHHADPAEAVNTQVGARPASHHQVGNLHLVKIPKVLEQRYRRSQKARADFATSGIKVPRHLGKAVKQIEDTDVKIHSRETEVVRGEPIVTKSEGFKEYPPEEGQKEE